MKKFVKWSAVLLLTGVCSAALAGANEHKPVGNLGNPGVLPPQSDAYGHTYGEWNGLWWKWVFSMSFAESPLIDNTGERVANGQSGHVWFLAGTWDSPTPVRYATIPRGTALFFPLGNNECSSLEAPPWYGSDEESLSDCQDAFPVTAYGGYVYIDGKPVKNLDQYYARSPVYTFWVPADNVFGVPGPTTAVSMAQGVCLLLEPLSVGTHIIRFGALDPDHNPPQWGFEVTYVLTVK